MLIRALGAAVPEMVIAPAASLVSISLSPAMSAIVVGVGAWAAPCTVIAWVAAGDVTPFSVAVAVSGWLALLPAATLGISPAVKLTFH